MDHGILLAGGTGSRLGHLCKLFNKHMLPVYDRFMIEYPIESLKNLGCKNVTIVVGGDQTGFGQIISFLKDGSQFGMKFNYVYQNSPSGIAQAIDLCREYVTSDKFAVILGDNVFEKPIQFQKPDVGAQIVLCGHPELHRFGVASIFRGRIEKIEEKPVSLDDKFDNFAIVGLYAFDHKFFDYFKNLAPSARGEYEITDIINYYHNDNDLYYTMSTGWWSDTGTFESIYKVASLVREQKNK